MPEQIEPRSAPDLAGRGFFAVPAQEFARLAGVAGVLA